MVNKIHIVERIRKDSRPYGLQRHHRTTRKRHPLLRPSQGLAELLANVLQSARLEIFYFIQVETSAGTEHVHVTKTVATVQSDDWILA
jgi:hypothetical protein